MSQPSTKDLYQSVEFAQDYLVELNETIEPEKEALFENLQRIKLGLSKKEHLDITQQQAMINSLIEIDENLDALFGFIKQTTQFTIAALNDIKIHLK